MFLFRQTIPLALASLMLAGAVNTASAAEGQWAKDHPRRAEVNQRLENQHKRINQEVREGEISRRQAAQLHREDRQIHQEERAMASQNHGHLTRGEQQVLNQQENAVSRQIGR